MILDMNSSNLTVYSGSVPAADCRTIQAVYSPVTYIPQTNTRPSTLLQAADTTHMTNETLPLHQIQQIPLPLTGNM